VGSVAIVLLVVIILVIILVAVGWLTLGFNMQFAKGQTANTSVAVTPPAPIPPTVVNTPTPTAPNPNFQYLPQKAYVQAYGPEIGLPSSGGLQPAPTVVVPAQQQAVPAANGGFDIGSILAIVTAAGAGLFAKLNRDKVNKVQDTTKENSASLVDTKIVQQEIARYMFNLDKAKAEALNDAPAIKLEKLEQDKKEATDTATKA